MAVSDKPWGSISESDYIDAATFYKYCLIDLNESGNCKFKRNNISKQEGHNKIKI
ncbi:MAG: hypothetical protein QJR05_06590 [Thermoanaerobacterium sp.]|nr:hypothetical protein [Thermoanaerobacterium sp.]